MGDGGALTGDGEAVAANEGVAIRPAVGDSAAAGDGTGVVSTGEGVVTIGEGAVVVSTGEDVVTTCDGVMAGEGVVAGVGAVQADSSAASSKADPIRFGKEAPLNTSIKLSVQCEVERSALLHRALSPHSPAVAVNNALKCGQPYSRAGKLSRSVQTLESAK